MDIRKLFKIGCFAVLLIIASCKGEDININTENDRLYDAALPAINYSFTIADGIKEIDDDQIFVKADGLVYLKFSKDANIAWDQLAMIKNLNERWNYLMGDLIFGLPVPPLGNPWSFTKVEKIKFNDKNDVRLDEGHFKKGDLELSIEVPSGVLGTIVLSIPESSPLITTSFILDGVNNSYSQYLSLEGRKIVFNQEIETSYVTLNMDANLKFEGAPFGGIDLGFKLSDVKTEKLYGYFGQSQSDLVTVTHELVDMQDVLGSAEIVLKEVTYTLKTNNYMGVPFNFEASNIRFNKTVNGDETNELLLVKGVSVVQIEVATAVDGTPIKPGENDFVVTESNSNIMVVGYPFPKNIILDLVSFSNPNGETEVRNFIGDVDSLHTSIDIEAPLWLKAKGYTRKDTIDFDFQDMMDQKRENADLIESLAMHMDFSNLLPFAANANVFVADANGNKIEDILSGFKSLLAVGEINDKGRVIKAADTNVQVAFKKEQILRFFDKKAMFLIVETEVSTYNYEKDFVKIFDDTGMTVSISFEVTGQLPNNN